MDASTCGVTSVEAVASSETDTSRLTGFVVGGAVADTRAMAAAAAVPLCWFFAGDVLGNHDFACGLILLDTYCVSVA